MKTKNYFLLGMVIIFFLAAIACTKSPANPDSPDNPGFVTDVDGNVYKTVKIGRQIWMAENLRVTKFNDGTAITKLTDSAAWYNIYVNNLKTPIYCYYNNTTNPDSIAKFGALYNWYVLNTRKIAPRGWHVPSDAEWKILENYMVLNGYNWDGSTDTSVFPNKIAKALATKTDWDTFPITGTIGCDLSKNNSSGFSAVPSKGRISNGMFQYPGSYGYWWSATEEDATYAWYRSLFNSYASLVRGPSNKGCGFCVRLVRD
jgi:uncharacterized protein (TIGR02145 family)